MYTVHVHVQCISSHAYTCTCTRKMPLLTTGLRGDFGERSANGLSIWRSLPRNVGLKKSTKVHTCVCTPYMDMRQEGYTRPNTWTQIHNRKVIWAYKQ